MDTRSPSPRTQLLESLAQTPSTRVLIIGGGINGLSTLRELALAGVDVTLVEKGDFASGASAGSSHMIHGGIRYLENGEVRLVKESLQERNRLLDNAPHYVRPLGTTIPIFSTFSGLLSAPLRLITHRSSSTKERGALLIKVGLVLYDLFGRKKGTLPRHQFHGRRKTLRHYPQMNKDVAYTAHYSDACVEQPERLAIDVLRDALALGNHVRALNYVEAIGLDGGNVRLRDTLSGNEFAIQADLVINATGPWVDGTNDALGIATSYMGGNKGSHIVVDNQELFDACKGREVFFENDDGRIVLILPILGRVLIGTTDIPVHHPDEAECTDEEIDYFIELTAHVFPGIPVDRSQIVYRYTGVRPLPAAGDLTPGVVSRDYRIVNDTAGTTPILSLVGGKWTTFRALGEHLAATACEVLGVAAGPSTENMAIGGGKDFPRTNSARRHFVDQHRGAIPRERADELLSRYGTVAADVLNELNQSGDDALTSLPTYSRQEIEWLIRHEWVETLSDLLKRRTPLAFTGQVTKVTKNELADVMAELRGWTAAVKKKHTSSV